MGLVALLMLIPVTLPVPVLRELVQERFGVSQLQTSLFMSINMVGAVLAAPLAGTLADRFGRRKQLIVGALLVDGVCFYAMTQDVSFGVFMAVRFFEGCAHIFALSLLLALASSLAGEDQRGRVMGLVGGAIMLGVAVGAPLGGVLGRADPLVPLRVATGLVLVAALTSAASLREGAQTGERRPGLGAIAAAVRENATLLAPLAFAFADRFTVGFFTSTFVLYLRTIHDLPSSQVGFLIAVFMLPFALLSYPFGWLSERYSRALLLCAGSVIYGVGTASLGWWPPNHLGFLMFGLGVSAAVMFVPSLIMTSDLAPEQIRSTAMGAFNAAGSLGFIVGPIVGGAVSQGVATSATWELGYRTAFIVAGTAEILCVLLTLPVLLRLVRAQRTT